MHSWHRRVTPLTLLLLGCAAAERPMPKSGTAPVPPPDAPDLAALHSSSEEEQSQLPGLPVDPVYGGSPAPPVSTGTGGRVREAERISYQAVSGLASFSARLSPPSERSLVRLVRSFLAAIVAEDLDAMAQLSQPGAKMWEKSSRSSLPLVEHWRARLPKVKYPSLSGEVLLDERHLRVHPFDSLAASWRWVASTAAQPADGLLPGDWVVTFAPVVPPASAVRWFGGEVALALRPTAEGLKICAQLEDYPLN